MTEEDYRELLQYLRNQLQQVGRPDLDESAFAAIVHAEQPSDAFFKYAETLLQDVHLESREGAILATNRLNSALQRADAGTVEEVVLLLGKEEQLVTGREEIHFEEALPSRSEFFAELDLLLSELRAERERTDR